ncbi:hypothetical protein AFK68_05990 [Hydrocoleum sp. CS-953]|nr:hypothetical protein AFK68_05990 [Hydrocoleum sp. CS-953]
MSATFILLSFLNFQDTKSTRFHRMIKRVYLNFEESQKFIGFRENLTLNWEEKKSIFANIAILNRSRVIKK